MSSQDALPKVPPPPLRAPLLMKVLAVLSLLCGVFSALSALADLNGAMRLDRDEYIVRVRERQVSLHQQLQKEGVSGLAAVIRPTVEPFLRLPAPEIERLSGLLGDELYERQAVNVPLCLLSLLLSWLLLSGSMGVLRGQVWAVSMWSWACMVNMPFALLSMLVTFQHSRSLVSRLGPPAAEALAKVSGRPQELELQSLQQLSRLYISWQAATLGLWVLLLGATVLYLQRLVVRLPKDPD
ncbi:MAG TPA: hypothetical protein PLA87_05740 [Pseudomonadota bacterium]|jgi:hypothetical protein|nr:hypothetical protein [Pseudomonadota bacterium]